MNRKETILEFLKDEKIPPVNAEEIMLYLDIPFDDREELMVILEELTDENLILKTSKKKYASFEKLGYLTGKVSVTAKGFGFLLNDEGDVFIAPGDLMGAINGDTVAVSVTKKASQGERREGRVFKIIKRGKNEIVGTFLKSRNFGFVVPDDTRLNYDIYIGKSKTLNAKDGQKVVAKITKWPDGYKKPEGEITEILGFGHEKGVDILSVMRSHSITDKFPQRVLEDTDNIDETISQADIDCRKDYRPDSVITIDGTDSRDFDDAVCVKKKNGSYILYVHIADVTHYVMENTPLDKEALKRGTSVYFPSYVVPMLPKKLSNGICSLNPNEDRLTLSIEMKISPDGEVTEHNITEGIICSKERMTYDDVTAILEGDKELTDKYSHIYPMLCDMKELCEILRKKRQSKGSIDFDFPEVKIKTDKDGKAVDVYKYKSGISNIIIEEFMLCANKTVAEQFFWADIPFVYRIHEKPSREKISAFNDFARNLGYRLSDAHEPHPNEFASILNKIKGTREEVVVSKVMLRSLMKAKYSPECLGHFGLAFSYYCHFTSPIRRYPDLAIHRIIKEFINGGISEKRQRYLNKFVADASQKSSEAEITAMEAQRDAEDMKKAEYMENHIGEDFSAIISSVTNFGFFAELENGIEGLVRVNDLDDDYYIFDERDFSLTGERSGKKYTIGTPVEITVANANSMTKQIDFVLKG